MILRRRRRVELEPYTFRYELNLPSEPEPWPEPWRTGEWAGRAGLLDRAVVDAVTNPAERRGAARDTLRISIIQQSVREVGYTTPLQINVGRACGKVVLKDGHHRLIAGENLGLTVLPVWFKIVERIPGWGVSVGLLVPAIFLTDRSTPAR